MDRANEHIAGSDSTAEAQAYQDELYRLTRLIWGLEEPIESSKRCIRELVSRPHVLSDDERRNLQSEELLLQKLEQEVQKLREQRDALRCSPAGLIAQEIEKMQQEITDLLNPVSPEEFAQRAKSFRRRAEQEARKRHRNFLTWVGVAIMMLVPAAAAVLWRT
ncbi:hypothetical protein H072_3159 [Dactylellina haptotyla CBS 200.50]|uniref:Uncharacterized protein n=1 Tax=Dactylellina haptotyla (strain CBS 200.50) TaxID=1284197 RepID=S8AP65_DACHA|nr:hypothetical protein H072_3159 [Dactylellina haptotyla CBS 200.50]